MNSKVYWSPIVRLVGKVSKLTIVGLVAKSSVRGLMDVLRLVRVWTATVVSVSDHTKSEGHPLVTD